MKCYCERDIGNEIVKYLGNILLVQNIQNLNDEAILCTVGPNNRKHPIYLQNVAK